MQKLSTNVFIVASVLFGILGVVMVFADIEPGDNKTAFEFIVGKLFMALVFVILSSFALSVAGKYLRSKK